MREEDIHKTTYKSHFAHYESLFMHFGLINAPTKFYSFTNHMFNKQLRKCMLVFFDDLLNYNKKWKDHLKHVDEILDIMKKHTLYAKYPKCEIGMT